MEAVYSVSKQVSVERNYKVVQGMHDLDPEFKQRMKDSGVRYKCTKDGVEVAVMYLLENRYRTRAVCMYATDVVGLMHLFRRMWEDTEVRVIEVVPHSREEFRQMVSMATGSSIRSYNGGVSPYILIDVARLHVKMQKWGERCQV